MLTAVWAVVAVPVLAVLHIHIHHFHGPEIDYLGLAAGSAASWIGIPGPGEPLLIAAGVLAARHNLDLASVILVAWLAATAGGVAGWLIGRVAGRGVLTAPGPLQGARRRAVERGEAVFARRPVVAILIAPSWVAGINRARPGTFLVTNAVSAVLWAGGIGAGAYLVGPSVVDFVNDLGTVMGSILVAAVLGLVVFELRRRWLRGRSATS
ncbi:MAG TPA: DedA family protein [Solirubrobacteraceae bacterium]|nr:DedA family protein [Solirubrobacteraceae bacterium]